MTEKRSSRAEADRHTRNRTIAALATFGAIAAGLGAAVSLGLLDRLRARPRGGEHEAPDLAADAPVPGTTRAPEAFRPDPTAAVPPEEREALRPATGPSPTLSEDRGALNGATASANG